MLTTEPTAGMIEKWKQIFEACHSTMKPNRKTGKEIDRYFREKYPFQKLDSANFNKIAALNITENEFSRSKLPEGTLPKIQSYRTGNVLVGIDLITGEFHIESENTEQAVSVYDDLFVYRGLDEQDLKNYFLVAEYVRLKENQNVVW